MFSSPADIPHRPSRFRLHRHAQAVSYWLLLKVFASGCTALTGVEAVSNGVKAFREPTVKNAQRSLTAIIFLLAVMLAGISYLVKIYGIAATDPGQPGYQSVLSMLTAAVFGKGLFYYLTIGSILVVLSLSANTAFADFPRLCRAIAQNNYLPHVFGYRGRRLVYTYGIVVLAVLCGGVLVLFGGRHRPSDPALRRRRFHGLHALASRHGHALEEESRPALVEERIREWARRRRHRHHNRGRTGCEVVPKGAWITHALHSREPSHSVSRLSAATTTSVKAAQTSCPGSRRPRRHSASTADRGELPIDRWSNITRQGLEFAGPALPGGDRPARGAHRALRTASRTTGSATLRNPSAQQARSRPSSSSCRHPTALSSFPWFSSFSTFRRNIPLAASSWSYPNSWRTEWYEYFLHNQRGRLLEWVLLARGSERIVTVSAPWYVGNRS